MDEVKLTIVTVCRNAESCIETAILSVLEQTFENYEYLIIDGASTDNTLEIVKKYEDEFVSKGIRFFYISEPDNGIYDAMNKSLQYSCGEWILFLNAGDSFFDKEVLRKLFSEDYSNADVVYGNVVLVENGKYKKALIGKITDDSLHSPICHQSTMIKTQLMKERCFDTKYRLAADYDLLLRLYNRGAVFVKTETVIAVFELGGASSKQSMKYLKEMNLSRVDNAFNNRKWLWVSLIRLRIYNLLRSFGINVLKTVFYSEKRGWFTDKLKAVNFKR